MAGPFIDWRIVSTSLERSKRTHLQKKMEKMTTQDWIATAQDLVCDEYSARHSTTVQFNEASFELDALQHRDAWFAH